MYAAYNWLELEDLKKLGWRSCKVLQLVCELQSGCFACMWKALEMTVL